MKALSVEVKKCKRSGVFPIMLAMGIVGALYVIANFAVRKNTLLALPLAPMDVLLTQLYGVIALITLFGIITATCLIYQVEHSDNAMKRMYMLPVRVTDIFLSKLLILLLLLLVAFTIQYSALGFVGNLYLPENSFELWTLIRYALYTFTMSLPVLLFMLFISSRISNMWITLGIGVAGFFSGMAAAASDSTVFLINPFILIIRPATSNSAAVEFSALMIAVVEIAVFLVAGYIFTRKARFE